MKTRISDSLSLSHFPLNDRMASSRADCMFRSRTVLPISAK